MLPMQYLKHPDTGGRVVYSEDKVIKALEKKFIKEWGLLPFTIETHGSAKSSKPTGTGTRDATAERWRSEASAYPGVIKVSPAQTAETILGHN